MPNRTWSETECKIKQITIRDVAREANVSISTVSRYLNGVGNVDQNAAIRISRAIEQLRYVPSLAAQALRSRTSHSILLVVPDICNPFYSKIAKTVQNILRDKGYVMSLYDSNESLQELAAIKIAKQLHPKGILFGSIDIKPEVIDEIKSLNIQTVVLNAYGKCPFDTVHVDGTQGTYLATHHLLLLGHRFVGYSGGTPTSMIGKSRREGFERAMKEANMEVKPEYVYEQGFSQVDGYEAGCYFAKLTKLPTAICCANDQIALGLLCAMQEYGIRIPEQVSVTGMDDIPYARISNPSLTSITNDSEEFAKEGVRMLLERIEGKAVGKPREVVVRHELIVRSSVDVPGKT